MALPRGITGFWRVGEPPPPRTDIGAFRGHCHAAARCLGGQVLSVENAGIRNFAVGTLAMPAGPMAVLLNAHYPLVGFADPPKEGEVLLRFRDCPALTEEFRGFGGYEVLATSDLERRPTPDDLRELSEVERTQVVCWKPERIGDVVFNCWD